jgi:hypothetical protein
MPGKAVTCAIHQPNLLPRLATLAKIYAADCWVVLDDVQFARRDYQHRCRLAPIGSEEEQQQWLTLPVHLKNGRATVIRDVTLVDAELDRTRVASLLRQFYPRARAGGLDKLIAELDSSLERSQDLVDVAETSTLALLRLVEWPGHHLRSSSVVVRAGRSERLADLTAHVGASRYLCGSGGARYLDEQPFAERGLTVRYFRAPARLRGSRLTGHRLSSVHALASLGAAELGELLRNWAADQRRAAEFSESS